MVAIIGGNVKNCQATRFPWGLCPCVVNLCLQTPACRRAPVLAYHGTGPRLKPVPSRPQEVISPRRAPAGPKPLSPSFFEGSGTWPGLKTPWTQALADARSAPVRSTPR